MPHIKDQSQRRRNNTKGDDREASILAAAEAQLADGGYDAITVASLMSTVGITRGAFYFYFRTKADVVAALLSHVLDEVASHDGRAPDARATTPMTRIRGLIDQTASLWRDHGPVMRAGVDLSATVPEIDDSWRRALETVAATATQAAIDAGLPDTSGPEGAEAIASALVWMCERTFYQASLLGEASIQQAAATAEAIWHAVISPATGDDAVDPDSVEARGLRASTSV